MRPSYWRTLLNDELIARRDDEGCDPQDIAEMQARIEAVAPNATLAELQQLYWELTCLKPRTRQPHEPSDLAGIQAARPEGPRILGQPPQDVMYDKIHGGWLGRAAGCALGKPVEGWSREQIEEYLAAFGERDVTDFFPFREDQSTLPRPILPHRIGSCRGQITHMQRDDDMDYTVLGLDIVKSKGWQFTTADVGQRWLAKIPYSCVYTAERVAYKNLVEGRTPPETAYHHNPYRQWIGAQIRPDAYGYLCPGQPELAASLAWRDAALSHTKNGIYGAMWVAAAIAAAFVTDDIEEIIAIATTEIPASSRYAAMVNNVRQWWRRYPTWQDCWTQINAVYGNLYRVHVLNNAALVLMGLLYGGGDFARSICIVVQGGWDTDCNGATVGSILGVCLGERALPRRWTGVFQNTLETAIFGYSIMRFDHLAAMTLELAQKATA